jgi:hypothetical protein
MVRGQWLITRDVSKSLSSRSSSNPVHSMGSPSVISSAFSSSLMVALGPGLVYCSSGVLDGATTEPVERQPFQLCCKLLLHAGWPVSRYCNESEVEAVYVAISSKFVPHSNDVNSIDCDLWPPGLTMRICQTLKTQSRIVRRHTESGHDIVRKPRQATLADVRSWLRWFARPCY